MKKFNLDSLKKLSIWLFVGTIYFFLYCSLTSLNLPKVLSPSLLYSNQAGDDLKLLFLSAIEEAKKTIYLEIYGLYDRDVITKLNQKALEGVDVFIRYDQDGSRDLEKKILPQIVQDPVSRNGLMHRKILIIDDLQVYLGSANLTTASLMHHDNLVFGIADAHLAYLLQYTRETELQANDQERHLTLYLLPEKDQKAFHAVQKVILSAKKSILVAMFTLTHPQLVESLIAAHKRGVRVSVAVDHSSACGASKEAVAKLFKANVPIILSTGKHLLHHKWALIDEKTLILGSANWTKSAFVKNEDFVFILNRISRDQKEKMRHVWGKIVSNGTNDPKEIKKKVA